MTTEKATPTFKQAEQAFTRQPSTQGINGAGGYRSFSINGEGETLVVDHKRSGSPIRAYIANSDGKGIQCYRVTEKGLVAKCSPVVYDWGWSA